MKKTLALAAAGAAALLIATEAGLRVLGYGAPMWHKPDPQLGWSLRAHLRGREGHSYVWINTSGQRDVDHTLDKPEGVYRIAVLGDSYSEAIPLGLDKIWWRQLGKSLEQCGFAAGRRVEVLNFGVAGYGTTQELVMLETTAMRYQPDLVLLQFSNRDDVMENSFSLAAGKDRPFFIFDHKGVARLDDSFVTSPPFERRAQFRYELAQEITDRSRILQVATRAEGFSVVSDAHAQQVAGTHMLTAPRDAVWEDAWRVTEAVIGKLHAYAGRNGAKLVVTSVPHPAQLAGRLSYPDERLDALGRMLGFRFAPLATSMQPRHYLASGEWTVEGHRAAAEALTQSLCAVK